MLAISPAFNGYISVFSTPETDFLMLLISSNIRLKVLYIAAALLICNQDVILVFDALY